MSGKRAGELFHVKPVRVGCHAIKTVLQLNANSFTANFVLFKYLPFFFLFSSMCLASRGAACVIKDAFGYVVLFAGRLQTRQLPT